MGRRRKPTNRDLTQGLLQLNDKVDTMCLTTQRLLTDFISFMKKEDKFKKYLEKRYESTKQSKDTEKSS